MNGIVDWYFWVIFGSFFIKRRISQGISRKTNLISGLQQRFVKYQKKNRYLGRDWSFTKDLPLLLCFWIFLLWYFALWVFGHFCCKDILASHTACGSCWAKWEDRLVTRHPQQSLRCPMCQRDVDVRQGYEDASKNLTETCLEDSCRTGSQRYKSNNAYQWEKQQSSWNFQDYVIPWLWYMMQCHMW